MARVSFARDRSGTVALLFALLLLPMVGLVGLAVDWSRGLQAKSQLSVAADAAAMSAATSAANGYNDGTQPTYAAARAYGEQIGENVFKSLTGDSLAYAGAAPVNQRYTDVAVDNSAFVATVNYSGSISSWFGRLFGVKRYKVVGVSQVTVQPPFHNDVYFLIDNSQQATQAATPLAQLQASQLFRGNPAIWNNVPGQPDEGGPPGTPYEDCAFACHWTNNGRDFYTMAEKANIPLRIDVMKAAVGSSIAQMQAMDGGRGMVRVGLFTFTNDVDDIFWPPKNDLSKALAATSQIQVKPILGIPASEHLGNTNITSSINSLLDNYLAHLASPKSGNGTAGSPIKSVVILTDGINDQGWGWEGGPMAPNVRLLTPIDPQRCDRIKSYGIKIYVLQTYYLRILTSYTAADHVWEQNYIDMVEKYHLLPGTDPVSNKTYVGDLASKAMQACASSADTYYQAQTPQEIAGQLKRLVKDIITIDARYTR